MHASKEFVTNKLLLKKNFLHIQGTVAGFVFVENDFFEDINLHGLNKYPQDTKSIRGGYTIVSDVCVEDIWEQLRDAQYDAIILSGVLEIARDPVFLCRKLIAATQKGYIETTSRFRECSQLSEKNRFLGNYHTRWILCVGDDGSLNFRRKGPWQQVPDILSRDNSSHLSRFWHQFSGFFWEGDFGYFELEPKSFDIEVADIRYFFSS